MSVRILLAEDEPEIREFIKKGLLKTGMSVESVGSFQDTETALLTAAYDLLILDRILNNQDSLLNLPHLRRKYPQQKVLILSGRGSVSDKVYGLNHGADDYLSKPFHLDELVARIRSLMRRKEQGFKNDNLLEIQDLRLDLESQTVSRNGTPIHLTNREFKILCLLANHPNKIFSKEELFDRIWDLHFDAQSNVIEAAMARLRSKINVPGLKSLIQSRRGAGYCLGE